MLREYIMARLKSLHPSQVSMAAAATAVKVMNGRNGHVAILLRNAFADCGISTYCGLAAIWLAVRDDSHYWEADFYVPRTARARHWLAQVSGRFIDLFGELRLVGRFSNGEAIFERSRSTCDTGC